MNDNERVKAYREIMPIHTRLDSEVLESLRFFQAPASTKFHGAYYGGLFDHSLEVTKALVELTERLNLVWERPESPYIVGMYHDLCKCDNYKYDCFDKKYIYNPDIIIPGHGDKSVIMLSKYLKLTDEENRVYPVAYGSI